MAAHLARSPSRAELANSEDAVVSKVGRDLYERCSAATPASSGRSTRGAPRVGLRALPVRHNDRRPLLHRLVPADARRRLHRDVRADARPSADRARARVRTSTMPATSITAGQLVWTGPIDDFFDCRLGTLPTGACASSSRPTPRPTAGSSSPSRRQLSRTQADPLHAHHRVPPPDRPGPRRTTITYEFPTADGDPYYPIPRPENRELYQRYERSPREQPASSFVGRLARYQYLNMDQVVAAAMVAVDRWAADRELATLPEAA